MLNHFSVMLTQTITPCFHTLLSNAFSTFSPPVFRNTQQVSQLNALHYLDFSTIRFSIFAIQNLIVLRNTSLTV